ncbi:MAG: PASTA domain-containing protein [Clostridia bacterium]|nr:PASTA domain-containing protein [Clostridia bacterium]
MAGKKSKKVTRKETMIRSIVVLALIIILFIANIASLFYVQIVNGDTYKAYAENNQLEDNVITAQRGVIYDCNMNILAESAAVWKVYVNPSNFTTSQSKIPESVLKQGLDDVSNKLAEIFELDAAELKEKFVSQSSYKYVLVKAKVEKTQRDLVSDFMKQYILYKDSSNNDRMVYYSFFIGIEADTKRYYPSGNLASTLIGFTGDGDTGRYGLEYEYDEILTGTDGRQIYSNSAMNTNSSVDFETVYDAEQGSSLVLTIDETIQRYLEDALDQCYKDTKCDTCYGIIMDVDTGAILAMSTKNDYDPNSPSTIYNESVMAQIDEIVDEKAKNEAISSARQNQWSNNAVSDVYEPGSVFKVFTLAAGIEENEVMDSFNCTSHIKIIDTPYNCFKNKAHGLETPNTALANSCNTYFITVGQRLGVSSFCKYFEAFGFTEKTGIDLPGEGKSIYFDPDEMSKVNLASCSFGQSFGVTGIQMITAVNAIANGGKLMQPYVVSKVVDNDGNVVKETQPYARRQVISESTCRQVLDAMVQTVETGTAKNAYVAGYNVAGKTGTSDNLTNVGQVAASFAGIAPANDPEISIIIVVDNPKSTSNTGGAVAAPVAAEVIENTLTYLNVKRNYTKEEAGELNVDVANFVGTDIETAKKNARDAGFTVKVSGEGDTVVSQCPAYGQYIPQDGVIILYTEKDSKTVKAKVPDFTGMGVSAVIGTATQAGVNIKISGNALSSSGLVAYRQNIEKDTEVAYGSTVTVYFKSGSVIADG